MSRRTKSPELLKLITGHAAIKDLYTRLISAKEKNDVGEMQAIINLSPAFMEGDVLEEFKEIVEDARVVANAKVVDERQRDTLEARFGNQDIDVLSDDIIDAAFADMEREHNEDKILNPEKYQSNGRGVSQEHLDVIRNLSQSSLTKDSLILISEIKDQSLQRSIKMAKDDKIAVVRVEEVIKIAQFDNPNITVTDIMAKLPSRPYVQPEGGAGRRSRNTGIRR